MGTRSEEILLNTAQLLSQPTAYQAMANAINPFGDGNAAERILQIVQNYLQVEPV